MKVSVLIVGAGVGGLSAAAALKANGVDDFLVVDPSPSLPRNLHNGLHYLHSIDWHRPFKFNFREIVCTEQVWDPIRDVFRDKATLPDAFAYSLKVMGLRHPSSIMDVGARPWKTFLPESNQMNDLLDAYGDYIGDNFGWGAEVVSVNPNAKVAVLSSGEGIEFGHLINTSPLNDWFRICGTETLLQFVHKPIFITNYKNQAIVPNWLVGLYVSDEFFPPYRITALGEVLSLESLQPLSDADEKFVRYHLGRHFSYDLSTVQRYEWKTGRIWGLTPSQRDGVVSDFRSKNIHLLGRFGRWDGKLVMDTTIVQAQEIVKDILKTL